MTSIVVGTVGGGGRGSTKTFPELHDRDVVEGQEGSLAVCPYCLTMFYGIGLDTLGVVSAFCDRRDETVMVGTLLVNSRFSTFSDQDSHVKLTQWTKTCIR